MQIEGPCALTADKLRLVVQKLYVGVPYVRRKLIQWRVQICPFERLIPYVRDGSCVLDVACGGGVFLALLAATKSGLTGTGIDKSQPAIETAMYMVAELKKFCPHANLHFLQVDIADRWPCGLFDVVSLIDILHHIPPAGQKSIFLKAASSVRPGGLLIYKDMADRPVLHALMNRLHDLLVAKQWIHYVPIRRIDEWAAEAGLAVIHEEEILRLWYHHEVRVYARP